MSRLLIVAMVLTVFGVLLASGGATAQQERNEVTVLIPLKYMSAATAAQIFGGTVIAPMPLYGQGAYGGRNVSRHYGGGYDTGVYGSGAYQPGPSIGGYGQRGFDLGHSFWR